MKKSNETIKVKSNENKKTFTIRKYVDGKIFAKYRTLPVSRDEFEEQEMNTEDDWYQFLKSGDYYKV